MSESAGKAVFLSYASQDAEAALRICAALRAAGVEVWFDQSELVSGDTWDRKIRDQIATCALFVPVISAHTQQRLEGYFRLEWKLAAQRTHTMADEKTFLLPVVIDSTRDADGKVPVEFRAVQWTKLPGGETAPAFVTRVQKLLAGPGAPTTTSAPVSSQPSATAPAAKFGLPLWGTVALGAFVLVLVAFVMMRPSLKEAASKPVAESKPAPPVVPAPVAARSVAVTPVANAKSIAVLPFANRSPDKENEFFTDGVHEDILTNLFNIRALRVVSRTSVEQYRGTKKSLKEIGAELGVAYILEGSVQRVGNKVRVTGQLIDARTDVHLWAKSFDKDLSDVFAIQAEVAKAIATELQTVLTPQEQKLIERRPTEIVAAYELYLKARATLTGTITYGTRSYLDTRLRLLLPAVELDPKFALAWCELAVTHGHVFNSHQEHTPARLAQADAALARAARLAPDAPETVIAQGWLAYLGHRDFARARLEFEKAIQLQPSNAEAIRGLATIQQLQGRWPESAANYRKALQLDPAGGQLLIEFAFLLAAGRRWDEVRTVREQLVTAQSQSGQRAIVTTGKARLAEVIFSGTGSTKAADDLLAGTTSSQPGPRMEIYLRKWRANLRGDYADWQRLDSLESAATNSDGARQQPETGAVIAAALTIAAHGDLAGARLRLGNLPTEVRSKLKLDPTNDRLWNEQALMEAVLGQKTEAVHAAGKAVELVPVASDAVIGTRYRRTLAVVQAWTGDKDRALAELTRLLRVPFGYEGSVHDLRVDPLFAPLRGDPRFEALLKDPKNSAPLF